MSDSKLLMIGLSGPARSGKGTVAKYLAALYGFHNAYGVGLGDAVRDALRSLDEPTGEMRKELADAGLVDRYAAQRIGTECRHDVGAALGSQDIADLLWVAVVGAKIRYATQYHPAARWRFVMPDIRYRAEHDGLQRIASAWGGHYETWKLERTGTGGALAGVPEHSSEQQFGTIPGRELFVNNGTYDALYAKVNVAMKRVLGEVLSGSARC